MNQNSLAVGFLVVAGGTTLAQPPAVTAPIVPLTPSASCATPLVGTAGPVCGRGGRLTLVGSEGQPFGLSVSSHFDGHVRAAEAARMVFHDYDFQPGSGKLNHRGWERVVEVAKLMGGNADPVVIERMPRDPKVAELRRLTVLAALTEVAPAVQPTRVVVAAPLAQPIRGPEAIIIHQTMLGLTASGGYLPSNSAGGATGGNSPSGGQPSGSPTTPNNR